LNILPASVSALRASTVACVIVLSAMTATSCTSTGSSPSVTSALAVTPETTPSGDAKQTADSSLPSGGNATVAPEALALAGSSETNALLAVKQATKPTDTKAAQTTAAAATSPAAETPQTSNAAAPADVKPPVKTSLFGSITAAKTEEGQQVASAATAAAPPARTSLFGSSPRAEPAPQTTQAQQAKQPADEETGKDAARTAAASPEHAAAPENKTATTPPPNKDSGLLVRLFANNQAKPAANRQVAIIQPKSQPQLRAVETPVQTASALPSAESFAGKTEHLSSLPGVRPNAGIQIMSSCTQRPQGAARKRSGCLSQAAARRHPQDHRTPVWKIGDCHLRLPQPAIQSVGQWREGLFAYVLRCGRHSSSRDLQVGIG
jgi:hypothetical protein